MPARPGLRVLLSACACQPGGEGESGTGWRWALALAQAGHEVWVVTRTGNRSAIEKALESHPQPRLHFAYYELPAWARWWRHDDHGAQLGYFLWQLGAYRVARALCRKVAFDVAHHVTGGTFRDPSFLAFLDLPFVFGPVGGGEAAPRELRETFPLRGCLDDLIREAANRAVRIDPLMALVYRRASAILCKSHETAASIPPRYRRKCVVQAGLGADTGRSGARECGRTGFRVLYAGELVYWKGLHLGLMAFAMFRQKHPDARLTVAGSGPDDAWFRRIAWLLGIGAAVTWMPAPGHAAARRVSGDHDAFLFPGLEDANGSAVLDAMSCGLPVVCLDAGSPAVLVDASCGIKVPPGSAGEVVGQLASALSELSGDPALLRVMSEAAARRAREEFSWPRQAARMGSVYRSVCVRQAPRFGATEAPA
jgi:glycosyltransferase involved in cell wall biosynthesis